MGLADVTREGDWKRCRAEGGVDGGYCMAIKMMQQGDFMQEHTNIEIKDLDTGTLSTLDLQALERMNEQYTTFSSACYSKPDGSWKEYWQEVKQAQDILFDAFSSRNLKEMAAVLATGTVHPDTAFTHKQTILHMAAADADLELAKLLIDHGASLQSKTSLGRTPLILAVIRNDIPMVVLLLNNGAKVNAQDQDLNTALHHSAEQCFKEMTQLLLERGADPRIRNNGRNIPAECCSDTALLCLLQTSELRGEYSRTVVGDVILSNSRTDHVRRLLKLTRKAESSSFTDGEGSKTDSRVKSYHRLQKVANSNIIVINIDKIRDVSISDFEIMAMLGRGAFGEVYYVEHINSGRPYAMKVLCKEKVLNNNLVRYANTEKNILRTVRHPFIVKLDYAFQNQQRLFMVLQYCSKGDLQSVLSRQKKLEEADAKVYICQILLALEMLHKNEIIFRDLKPGNVVIDDEGHAKLTDFGLSKKAYTAKSFCGSIAYLAPEMIRRREHGFTLDWYLLGVLLYELLIGMPPYYATTKEKLFQNILKQKLVLPAGISPSCQDLIRKLMQRNPLKRLGHNNDAQDIKGHEWFRDINWDDVYERKLPAPKCAVRRPVVHNAALATKFSKVNSQ